VITKKLVKTDRIPSERIRPPEHCWRHVLQMTSWPSMIITTLLTSPVRLTTLFLCAKRRSDGTRTSSSQSGQYCCWNFGTSRTDRAS